jgi:hypothetical protein
MIKRQAHIPHMSRVDRLRVGLKRSLSEGLVNRGAIFLRLVVFGDIIGLEMAGAGKCAQVASLGLREAQAPDRGI